jgi:Hsp20/alpha crystallin family
MGSCDVRQVECHSRSAGKTIVSGCSRCTRLVAWGWRASHVAVVIVSVLAVPHLGHSQSTPPGRTTPGGQIFDRLREQTTRPVPRTPPPRSPGPDMIWVPDRRSSCRESRAMCVKAQKKEEKDERLHRVERSWGAFMRSVRLPAPVDAAKVTATFKERRRGDHAAQGTRRLRARRSRSRRSSDRPRAGA